ncbi:putative KHG/KDPG aldolase [subsurface metagenome]
MIKKLKQIGIIPVAKLENPAHAIPLAKALLKGGIPCIEITFRSAAAEESIRRISQELPEILVGAGTILTIEQAQNALRAGAKFLVTPGFNPKIVDFAQAEEVHIFPGVNNPTNIEAALEKGLEVLKFFPAEQSGGCEMLKAFSGPYQKVKFIPTGGINIGNLNDYLSLPNVVACGGSWLVAPKLINSEKFKEIGLLAAPTTTIYVDGGYLAY